ncbi:MAG: SDR family oxidoreductase [Dehalococcoidia bacterium]|nr:MAG: SDR family oxidoreductase [Dehalococcoidia bacterium]
MRKRLLFVGSSGESARKLIPHLAKTYDIVGIARSRRELEPYLVEQVTGDLLTSHEQVFDAAFRDGPYDAIIWNAVAYFIEPLTESTRESLHTEFDLAVALPMVCLKRYAQSKGSSTKRFIMMSSQMAFGHKAGLGSYSVMKRAQVTLIGALALEVPDIICSAITPGSLRRTSEEALIASIEEVLHAHESGQIHRVDESR